MDKFITKYDKLALNTKTKTKDGAEVYKVPGQNILILKKTSGIITIDENNASYDKPFTMIIKGGADLVIKGSLAKTNGMFLVDRGDILFDPDAGCTEKQTVQGIFVTNQNFDASKKLLNSELDQARCAQGGLYVKGVLIGGKLEQLVQKKRSQLDQWFTM